MNKILELLNANNNIYIDFDIDGYILARIIDENKEILIQTNDTIVCYHKERGKNKKVFLESIMKKDGIIYAWIRNYTLKSESRCLPASKIIYMVENQ